MNYVSIAVYINYDVRILLLQSHTPSHSNNNNFNNNNNNMV